MNRSVKLSLFCAGIFACGVVAGGLGARKFHQPPAPPKVSKQGGMPEGFGPQQLQRFSKELALSEAQREKVAPILEKAGEELRQLRRESFRQSSVIIEAMEAAVAERLTHEQREKLVVLQTEQRARIKARMEERNRRRSEGGGPNGEPRRDGETPGRRPDGPPPPPNAPGEPTGPAGTPADAPPSGSPR